MICIFCKKDSSKSVSVEHIIPESLGNSKHVLPRGIVCDRCNSYFATKVEKPLLDSEYFVHKRFSNFIPNKKGRIPSLENVFGPEGVNLGLSREQNGLTHLYPIDENDSERFVRYVLTHKVQLIPGWEQDVVFKVELDEIRRYARCGEGKIEWPYYERRLYEEHKKFTSETGEHYEVVHEFNTLYTRDQELYVVVVILGVEYTINLGGPKIDSYIKWLEENEYRSHLYPNGI